MRRCFIAGNDGIDDRQPYNWPQGHVKFGEELTKFLDSPTNSETPLKGIKVGILKEGSPPAMTDSNVAATSRSAISKLKDLGAEVKEISIPFYKDSGLIWMLAWLWYVFPEHCFALFRMFQEL